MKKLTPFVLLLVSCVTTKPDPIVPVCAEPPAVVSAFGVAVEFTPAFNQTAPGIAICVYDPSGPAMLCMTPPEAAERAKKSSLADLSP